MSFPTCQVRVVRFYVSWPPSPPPTDLNCKLVIAVVPAGPEQQAQDQSVPRRASTASAKSQWSPAGPECSASLDAFVDINGHLDQTELPLLKQVRSTRSKTIGACLAVGHLQAKLISGPFHLSKKRGMGRAMQPARHPVVFLSDKGVPRRQCGHVSRNRSRITRNVRTAKDFGTGNAASRTIKTASAISTCHRTCSAILMEWMNGATGGAGFWGVGKGIYQDGNCTWRNTSLDWIENVWNRAMLGMSMTSLS